MTTLPQHFNPTTNPTANPQAVVTADEARFTVLTSRLIRMEYNPNGTFEDRPSQTFWHRNQPVPDYFVDHKGEGLEIHTEHLTLKYASGEPFDSSTLSIQNKSTGSVWRFGTPDSGNLGGTARTLDNIDGQIPIEPGLISRLGWTVVDDTHGLVFDRDGWVVPRESAPDTFDLYFFGYGHAYQECLSDFSKIAGHVPILPRWALGNWWSRYWAYTQDELIQLMQEFNEHQIPLSVCIIDMDWHLIDTGNQCSGWTGYTWNRGLFPDPQKFLARLGEMGLKKSLNIHPAEGIHPHEEMYPEMAHALGIDPKVKQPVSFDPEDPRFVQAYFELLHHPQEEMGIDFWWIDWQQGNPVRTPGLNLLWWINHLHFQDSGRSDHRPFIFSRWGGLGNHRYPIGFSGDAYITWDSLAFQPYFTATAANVGYGWWSHDIGGHMGGIESPELYTRWVQYGVFSPIFRLHSTNNPFHERRPWGYDAEVLRITRQAMQLRHALIPYLYSMAWKNHKQGISPIRPMYYLHPDMDQAYCCPNQYMFGSELMAAPFTSPRDADTRLSRQVVWFPPSEWFDFFDGEHMEGDSWQAVYGGLDDIPIFARSGAIIPLADLPSGGGIDNPTKMTIHIFPGADNEFELFEDDGETKAYTQDLYAITRFTQKWSHRKQSFQIHTAEGDPSTLPARREYDLVFQSITNPDRVVVRRDNKEVNADAKYHPHSHQLTISGIVLTPYESLDVEITIADGSLLFREDNRNEKLRSLLRAFHLASYTKQAVHANAAAIIADPTVLAAFKPILEESHLRAILELLTGAGVDHLTNSGPEQLILWNNNQDPIATYQISPQQLNADLPRRRDRQAMDTIPRFRSIRPDKDFPDRKTELAVSYGDMLTIKSTYKPDN